MRYIEVPGVKTDLSQMVLGAEYFYESDDVFRHALLDQWLDQGGNAIDTAAIYATRDGEPQSERTIGRWLVSRGNRDEVVIVTKCCHPWPDVPHRVSAAMMAADVEGSLAALQTDYIDILLLHRDDPDVPAGEVIDWLNEHKDAGHVHAFGASNWSLARYREADEWAAANGKTGFSLMSNYAALAGMNNPLWPGCRDIDAEYAAWLKSTGTPNLSWSGLSHGFFSGRFSPDKRDQQDMVGAFYSDANWARLARAREFGEERGWSATQVALAWALNRDYTALAAFWVGNFAEFRQALAMASVELSPEEMDWLANAGRPRRLSV